MRINGIDYRVCIYRPDIVLESDEHDLIFFRGYAELEWQKIEELVKEVQKVHGTKWEGRVDYSLVHIDNEMLEDYVRVHIKDAIKFNIQ